jgi:NADH-quinone oxidoreductase subunit C
VSDVSEETTPETGGEQSSAERPTEDELAESSINTEDELAESSISTDELVAEQSSDLQGDRPSLPLLAGHERDGMFGVHGSGDTSGFGGLRLPAYAPAPAERPYGGWFDDFAEQLADVMSERGLATGAIRQVTVDRGEITLYVQRDRIRELCQLLRDSEGLRFELLSSVSGVDYGEAVPDRLHVVYHLTSMTYRRRIRLEVSVGVADPHLPSVVEVYPTADFQERETWDMFGVIFDGHPALTRILMPDDWEGHPQRKDYPLGGIAVEYKGAEIPPPDQRRAYS